MENHAGEIIQFHRIREALLFFLILNFIIIASFGIIPLQYLTPLALIIPLNLLKIPKEVRLVGSGFVLISVFLIHGSIKEFQFIPQAKYLLDSYPGLWYWFATGHPHAVRLLVAYPSYLLAEAYNIPLNLSFSYYCVILFFLMYIYIQCIISRTNSLFSVCTIGLKSLVVAVALIFLEMRMNGRILFALLGYCIIMHTFITSESNLFWKIVSTMIGLTLTTVSSGTMSIAVLYIIIMLSIIKLTQPTKTKLDFHAFLIVVCLFPLIISFFRYFYKMLLRNVDYFGGGIVGAIRLLEHGAGRIFMHNTFFAITGIIALYFISLLIIIYFYQLIKSKNELLPLIIAASLGVLGILFGYSTGTLCIPPFLVLFVRSL